MSHAMARGRRRRSCQELRKVTPCAEEGPAYNVRHVFRKLSHVSCGGARYGPAVVHILRLSLWGAWQTSNTQIERMRVTPALAGRCQCPCITNGPRGALKTPRERRGRASALQECEVLNNQTSWDQFQYN
jgi:hypothetical protein